MSRLQFRTSVVVRAAGVLLLAPLLAACTDPPADGLTGTAVVLSDIGGSDTPITKGWIIAVPAAAVDDLWSAAGNKPIDQQNLRYISARVSRDQVTQAGGVVAPLDDDGEFVLPAKEGAHLLCHLEQGESGREWARGCGFLTLPASGELEITDGEGGFSVGMKQ